MEPGEKSFLVAISTAAFLPGDEFTITQLASKFAIVHGNIVLLVSSLSLSLLFLLFIHTFTGIASPNFSHQSNHHWNCDSVGDE